MYHGRRKECLELDEKTDGRRRFRHPQRSRSQVSDSIVLTPLFISFPVAVSRRILPEYIVRYIAGNTLNRLVSQRIYHSPSIEHPPPSLPPLSSFIFLTLPSSFIPAYLFPHSLSSHFFPHSLSSFSIPPCFFPPRLPSIRPFPPTAIPPHVVRSRLMMPFQPAIDHMVSSRP